MTKRTTFYGIIITLFAQPLMAMQIPDAKQQLSAEATTFIQNMPQASAVGIYCGTFDPIHAGHIANIQYCLTQGSVDILISSCG